MKNYAGYGKPKSSQPPNGVAGRFIGLPTWVGHAGNLAAPQAHGDGKTSPLRDSTGGAKAPMSGKQSGQPSGSGKQVVRSGAEALNHAEEERKRELNEKERAHRARQEQPEDTPTGNKIVIHVCDENRKVNKDFKCDKTVLLAQMKYFEKFKPSGATAATAASALEDLDISVHCDIQIFEWLMKYLQNPQAQSRTLEIGTVISILISADYLQMPHLVEECVDFIKCNLQEVLKLQIDMNCISPPIQKKLAMATQIEELDEIKERKDKLLSKLYIKKLELLLEDENNSLFRCVYCNKLFTRAQKAWMVCAKAKIFIDFHGNVIAEHVADRSWDSNKFISFLRHQGSLSWREVYWKIWARLTTLHCAVCDHNFVAAEVGHCSYHSQNPKFGSGTNRGVYACCNAPAIRFDTALKTYGCQAKMHELSAVGASPADKVLMKKILDRAHIIAEPFISEHNYAELFHKLEISQAQSVRMTQPNAKTLAEVNPLSKIRDSPSLQVLLSKYVANVGESCYSVSEDEDDEREGAVPTLTEHSTEPSRTPGTSGTEQVAPALLKPS